MNNIIFIVLFLIIIITGSFIQLRLKMKQSIKAVITSFYKENSLTKTRALTLEELGLKSRGILHDTFNGRDYRPYAIRLLKKGNIIQATVDGRLFLSKEKMIASGIDNYSEYEVKLQKKQYTM